MFSSAAHFSQSAQLVLHVHDCAGGYGSRYAKIETEENKMWLIQKHPGTSEQLTRNLFSTVFPEYLHRISFGDLKNTYK